MPIHDWNRVEAGIFHAFHHQWITVLSNALNEGALPASYYALPEQYAAGFGPDVLALQTQESELTETTDASPRDSQTALLAKPALTPTAETDLEFYRRKQNCIAIRHVSGDRLVAMVEIISPGNKSSRRAMRSLLENVAELLDGGIHLLLIDLFPPMGRDPQGLHAAIWEEVAGRDHQPPAGKPLTLVSYESALSIRAYVKEAAVGEALASMPLFLESANYVMTPLDSTYETAFQQMPRRWRDVLG